MGDTNSSGSKAEFYAGYTYEDMNRFGFIFSTYSESHPNNLAGPIHPIFHPHNWEDDEFTEVMTPVLRLATNILLSPNSRRFIHDVFFANRKVLVNLSNQLGRDARQIDRIEDIPYSVILTRTISLLRKLAHCVDFKWFDPSHPRISPNQVAFCSRNPRDLAWMFNSTEPTGHLSRISLNLDMVRKLAQLRSSAGVGGVSSQILRIQYMIASTLCHEVVHACNHSITLGGGHADPFFEDDRISELGHAWSSAVFGGIWYPHKDFVGTYPLLVVKWPSFERRAEGFSLERELPPPIQTKYFIPMDWIARIQQEDEWLSNDPRHYATLLRTPKTLGFREVYPYDDFDPDWASDDSSNMDYEENAAGQVTREPL